MNFYLSSVLLASLTKIQSPLSGSTISLFKSGTISSSLVSLIGARCFFLILHLCVSCNLFSSDVTFSLYSFTDFSKLFVFFFSSSSSFWSAAMMFALSSSSLLVVLLGPSCTGPVLVSFGCADAGVGSVDFNSGDGSLGLRIMGDGSVSVLASVAAFASSLLSAFNCSFVDSSSFRICMFSSAFSERASMSVSTLRTCSHSLSWIIFLSELIWSMRTSSLVNSPWTGSAGCLSAVPGDDPTGIPFCSGIWFACWGGLCGDCTGVEVFDCLKNLYILFMCMRVYACVSLPTGLVGYIFLFFSFLLFSLFPFFPFFFLLVFLKDFSSSLVLLLFIYFSSLLC